MDLYEVYRTRAPPFTCMGACVLYTRSVKSNAHTHTHSHSLAHTHTGHTQSVMFTISKTRTNCVRKRDQISVTAEPKWDGNRAFSFGCKFVHSFVSKNGNLLRALPTFSHIHRHRNARVSVYRYIWYYYGLHVVVSLFFSSISNSSLFRFLLLLYFGIRFILVRVKQFGIG